MRIRTVLLFALTLCLILFAAGCTDTSGEDGVSKEGGEAATESANPTTIEELRTQAEEEFSTEEWWPQVLEIREVTILGAPTIWVMTDISTDEPDANDIEMAIDDAISSLDPLFAYNLEVRAFFGDPPQPSGMGRSSWGGTTMTEAFDLPPAPQSAEELTAWFESVFGPEGMIELGADETWYSSITSIELLDDPYGNGDVLAIRTTFTDDGSQTELEQIELLEVALDASGTPLAESYAIYGSSGDISIKQVSTSGSFEVGVWALGY